MPHDRFVKPMHRLSGSWNVSWTLILERNRIAYTCGAPVSTKSLLTYYVWCLDNLCFGPFPQLGFFNRNTADAGA